MQWTTAYTSSLQSAKTGKKIQIWMVLQKSPAFYLNSELGIQVRLQGQVVEELIF